MPRLQRKNGKRKQTRTRGRPRGGLAPGLLDTRVSLREIGGAVMDGYRHARNMVAAWNVEEKFLDVTQNAVSFSAGGGVLPLSLMAQGSDYNQRTGNSVRANELYVSLSTSVASTAVITQAVRILIFCDEECHGATPAVADVLEAATVLSPLLHTVGSRFRVLADWRAQLSTGSNDGFIQTVAFPWKEHVLFKGTTAAASDSWEGQLYALFITDAASNFPTYSIHTRLSYVDN